MERHCLDREERNCILENRGGELGTIVDPSILMFGQGVCIYARRLIDTSKLRSGKLAITKNSSGLPHKIKLVESAAISS